jgi:catechol 2,3-dioxygenase-like lactoylglutathione lyase family enzyme
MLSSSDIIALVATSDAERARAFYEVALGLTFVEDGPYALVFDANGIMLRIQKVEKVTVGSGTALGWRVDDIAAAVRALIAKGVRFERFGGMDQDELGVWHSGTARVAWFKDPDGQTLSLTQFDSDF